ncbi:MAG: class II glutamine amidotransferase, partial [Lysobacterales bacterium]
MCGIVAASARRNIRDVLIAGLHTLEYRGYDSAGIALQQDGYLARLRAAGKVKDLEALLESSPIDGHCGISHTRWATHGAPNTENAHPHTSGDQLALVHNGIIENHEELRLELQQSGRHFSSETDTEVMVHLIARYMDSGLDLFSAVRKAVGRLRGAFA